VRFTLQTWGTHFLWVPPGTQHALQAAFKRPKSLNH